MKSASVQTNSNNVAGASFKSIVKAKREKGVITTVQVINVASESPHDNNYHKAAAEYFLFIAEMEGLIK
jgi:hypothetical protein